MAEEKDVNEREQPTKKSKFKLILFGIIILVLVIAGFLAYLFFFSNKSATQTGNVLSPEVQTTPSSKDPSNIGPLYSFDTFIVNLADPGGTRYLKVSMQAELDSNRVMDEIEKRKPQVRDLILTVLSSKTYAEVSTPQGKIALKQEIIRRLNLILTTGTVRNIYFTEFVSQ